RHSRDLRERLDDEHAGHHLAAGEVPLEEPFVRRHALDAYTALPVLDLDDAIDEKEGVAVGNDLLDLVRFDHDFTAEMPVSTSADSRKATKASQASSGKGAAPMGRSSGFPSPW